MICDIYSITYYDGTTIFYMEIDGESVEIHCDFFMTKEVVK